jgi:hypothetical protein
MVPSNQSEHSISISSKDLKAKIVSAAKGLKPEQRADFFSAMSNTCALVQIAETQRHENAIQTLIEDGVLHH